MVVAVGDGAVVRNENIRADFDMVYGVNHRSATNVDIIGNRDSTFGGFGDE